MSADPAAPPSPPESGKATVTERVTTGIWPLLVKWLRVPKEPPTLPAGSGDRVESFRPATGFLRYLRFWFWLVLALVDVVLFALWVELLCEVWWLALLLLPVALVLIVVPDIVAYVAIQLRFDVTWYVMTERSLLIRRGIWVIRETTVTFENVQNLKVRQGPLQRYFGISDLVIETAGSGGGSSGAGGSVANQAVIEGVANAHELRDMILPRIRRSRSTGLGDDESGGPNADAWTKEQIALLRKIRDEAAGL